MQQYAELQTRYSINMRNSHTESIPSLPVNMCLGLNPFRITSEMSVQHQQFELAWMYEHTSQRLLQAQTAVVCHQPPMST